MLVNPRATTPRLIDDALLMLPSHSQGHGDARTYDPSLGQVACTPGLTDGSANGREGHLDLLPPSVIAAALVLLSTTRGSHLTQVFLNACMIFPLGLMLIEEGVLYVIGWVTRVENRAAMHFSTVSALTSTSTSLTSQARHCPSQSLAFLPHRPTTPLVR